MLSPSYHQRTPLRVLTLLLALKPTPAVGERGGELRASMSHTCTRFLGDILACARACLQRRHAECAQRQSRTPELKWRKMQRVHETRLPRLSVTRAACTRWPTLGGSISAAELVPPGFPVPLSFLHQGRGLSPRHREFGIMSRAGLTALCCQQSRCHLPVY